MRAPLWVVLCTVALMPSAAWAHGVLGQRLFPASLTVEDPFPADEFALTVESRRHHDERELVLDAELQKRLTPNLGIAVGSGYAIIHPDAGPVRSGGTNPAFALNYALYRNAPHEWIATASIGIAPGGLGSDRIGAEDLTTVAPAFLFGKGFGDLPDGLALLRPLAVTGRIGFEIPWGRTDAGADAASHRAYGLVLEYSIPYLQSAVVDVGIPWPFNRLFPVVELTYDAPMTGPDAHRAEAFLNPGLIWAGKYAELGLEASIPLNDRSGDHLGIVALIHLFLDDLAPDRLGRPLLIEAAARP